MLNRANFANPPCASEQLARATGTKQIQPGASRSVTARGRRHIRHRELDCDERRWTRYRTADSAVAPPEFLIAAV